MLLLLQFILFYFLLCHQLSGFLKTKIPLCGNTASNVLSISKLRYAIQKFRHEFVSHLHIWLILVLCIYNISTYTYLNFSKKKTWKNFFQKKKTVRQVYKKKKISSIKSCKFWFTRILREEKINSRFLEEQKFVEKCI